MSENRAELQPEPPPLELELETTTTVLQGDCRQILKTLPSQVVQTIITSPPYWGQRAYLQAGQSDKAAEIGTEPDFKDYITHLVAVFGECRRVLRDDGILWVNLGDKAAQDTKWGGGLTNAGKNKRSVKGGYRSLKLNSGLADKNILGLPWRVAFALQDAGWILRQEIIWEKTNAKPENVLDRPTRSHEYLFMLTKKKHYYYDTYAYREKCKRPGDVQTFGGQKGRQWQPPDGSQDPNYRAGHEQWGRTITVGETRNLRSVWQIPTQPYAGAHYATFPEALVERLILLSTSEKGCCGSCQTPYRRRVSRQATYLGRRGLSHVPGNRPDRVSSSDWQPPLLKEEGWLPSCHCPVVAGAGTSESGPIVPCTVLDPFAGSGTTGRVAARYGRRAILIELNPDYLPQIEKRLDQIQMKIAI